MASYSSGVPPKAFEPRKVVKDRDLARFRFVVCVVFLFGVDWCSVDSLVVVVIEIPFRDVIWARASFFDSR